MIAVVPLTSCKSVILQRKRGGEKKTTKNGGKNKRSFPNSWQSMPVMVNNYRNVRT